MKNSLLIFDYDKTLANAIELQKVSSAEIFKPFGIESDLTAVDYDGSTHYKIISECFKKVLNLDPTKEMIELALQRWLEGLNKYAPAIPVIVYNNVRELLAVLRQNASLGFLTGNPASFGNVLLQLAQLSEYFPEQVRVFGEEFDRREEGIIICIEKSEDYYSKHFDKAYYIADSPKDIQATKKAAQLFPSKIYSAVVSYDNPQLAQALLANCPDLHFDNFNNLEDVLSAFLKL